MVFAGPAIPTVMLAPVTVREAVCVLFQIVAGSPCSCALVKVRLLKERRSWPAASCTCAEPKPPLLERKPLNTVPEPVPMENDSSRMALA